MRSRSLVTLTLAGCGLLTPDPDAEIRQAATKRLNADDSSHGHPYTVLRAGKAAAWRRQDADTQQARHMRYDIERTMQQQEEIGQALARLKSCQTAQEPQPLRIRYAQLRAEINRQRAVQDSLLRTNDTTQIGVRILLVYRSEFLGTVDTSTFIVLPDGRVERMLEAD